jgi:hypothetical protein
MRLHVDALQATTEYEAFFTWKAMAHTDTTAPDYEDFTFGLRTVGGTWTTGAPGDAGSTDSLEMFSGSGTNAEYFSIVGNEATSVVCINWNGTSSPGEGTMHDFRLYNSHLDPTLMPPTATVYDVPMHAPAFVVASDDRVKHRERPIRNGLAVLRQLRPQRYYKTFRIPDYPSQAGMLPGHQEAGLIAQQVETVPELANFVNRSPTDVMGVDYNSVMTYTLAALQELDARVTALE